MPPKRKAREDNVVPKRVTRRRQQPIADATPVLSKKDSSLDEPDELNLSSTKPLVPPSTPGPRPGPSRLVMDCVEIMTPRAIAFRTSAACASPTTNGAAVLKLKADSIHKVPSTPSKQPRPGPASPLVPAKTVQLPSTPSRVRPPHTPRVSPSKLHHQSNDVPVTPSRHASRLPSPKKGSFTSLPSPVKLPSVLPTHLVPCLRLQKRAILNALQPSLSSEDLDDHGHSSTNSTAYTQLHNLLHGTVTRGEGNSCLLLGPRGSGKTSVRLSYS